MNWIIKINGLVIADEEELRQQVAPLVMEEVNLNGCVAAIWEAANGNQPSEVINRLSETEPGVTACLEFERPPEAAPGDQVMELRQQPIDTAIATTAATQLLADLNDHFIMSEATGLMTINGENPPTIEQSGEMVQRLMALNVAAERLEEFGAWQTGSLIDAVENLYGEAFNIGQWVETTEKAYNTLVTAVSTYRAFAQQRYNGLSFTHHKEAHFCKLPNDDEERSLMHRGMQISEMYGLSCADQRKLFKFIKEFGIEPLNEDIPETMPRDTHELDAARAENERVITDREGLVDRVTIREATRNYIFKFRGAWYHIRGIVDAIPAGATTIISTDDRRIVQRNGDNVIPREWDRATPVDDPPTEEPD